MFVPLLEYCNLDCLPLALKKRIFLDRLQIHGLKGEMNLSLPQCPAIDSPVGWKTQRIPCNFHPVNIANVVISKSDLGKLSSWHDNRQKPLK